MRAKKQYKTKQDKNKNKQANKNAEPVLVGLVTTQQSGHSSLIKTSSFSWAVM